MSYPPYSMDVVILSEAALTLPFLHKGLRSVLIASYTPLLWKGARAEGFMFYKDVSGKKKKPTLKGLRTTCYTLASPKPFVITQPGLDNEGGGRHPTFLQTLRQPRSALKLLHKSQKRYDLRYGSPPSGLYFGPARLLQQRPTPHRTADVDNMQTIKRQPRH